MKKLSFMFIIFLWGCTKPELPEPTPPSIQKIFEVSESTVTNGQDIYFNLPSSGVYNLSLVDKESGQVLSRERFNGIIGENKKKIYTNSLSKGYLYLVLEDINKKEIIKTTIIIN